jgi:hypothetical protein
VEAEAMAVALLLGAVCATRRVEVRLMRSVKNQLHQD